MSFIALFAFPQSWKGILFSLLLKEVRAISENKERLLQILRDCAHAIGHTPIKSEFSEWRELKRCFGSWEKAVKAAGLEPANSPNQHAIRAKQRRESLGVVIGSESGGLNEAS